MGRTVPSFRIVLQTEKEQWKPFRNALDKSDRNKFVNEMLFDILDFLHSMLTLTTSNQKKRMG